MLTKNRLGILITILLCSPLAAFSEREDAQFWNQYVVVGKIANDTSLFLEFQPRVGGDFESLSLFIARGAIGYHLNFNWSLWQGYGWVPTFTDNSGRNDEHRFFQQLLGAHTAGDFTIINRTRFEQRLLEQPSQTSYRLRHLVRFNYQPESFGKIYLGTYNEIFLNLNSVDSPGLKSGIDQNRLFLGLGYAWSNKINLEFGYIYNYIRNANQDLTNHAAFFGTRYNF